MTPEALDATYRRTIELANREADPIHKAFLCGMASTMWGLLRDPTGDHLQVMVEDYD